jgi:molybdate transport system substrate-binding protein
MKKLLLFSFILISFFSCKKEGKPPLRIATAANVLPAMEEWADAFMQSEGIECEIIQGSSGKLALQISQGAPYDLFFSADMNYPQKLFEEGFCDSPPSVYANGKLILWSLWPSISLEKEDSIPQILSQIEKLAIPNPRYAPYGIAATQYINSLTQSHAIQQKLIFGESVSQCNQFIISQSAKAGFSSLSTVRSLPQKEAGSWYLIPDSLYQPIQQGAVIIKAGQVIPSQLFLDFIRSEKGQSILEKFGYEIPESHFAKQSPSI